MLRYSFYKQLARVEALGVLDVTYTTNHTCVMKAIIIKLNVSLILRSKQPHWPTDHHICLLSNKSRTLWNLLLDEIGD